MLPPWTALGLWGQEEGRVSLPVSVQAETRVMVRSQLYSQESSGTGQQVRAQRPRHRSSPELVWKTGPRINYPCPSPCVSYEGFERNRRGYETGAVSELSAARGGLSSIRLGVDACHPGLVTHSGPLRVGSQTPHLSSLVRLMWSWNSVTPGCFTSVHSLVLLSVHFEGG